MNPGDIFTALGAIGGLGAIATLILLGPNIRKIRAEAGKARVDAAVAEDRAEDDHWRDIVTAQTEALVKPLRDEVERLGTELASLRRELHDVRDQRDQERHRYRSAIGYVRVLLAWIRNHNGGTHPMDLPVPPSEIAGDV